MPTDISKSSKEQLFDLVLQNNPSASEEVLFSKIDFTTPEFSNIAIGLAETTIFAIPNTGLRGSVDLVYSKLDLNDFLTIEADVTVYLPHGSTYTTAIAAFNEIYGGALSADDYEAGTLAPLTDEGEEVEITAKVSSYAYYGNIPLTVKLLSFPMSNFITNTDAGALTLPIIQAAQFITFPEYGDQDFGTNPAISATSTSNLEVTLINLSPSVCELTDGILTFLQTGICRIEASQAGNDYFLAAEPIERQFTVNAVIPSNPTITGISGGAGTVTVAFNAPDFNGGSAITSYQVTLMPGNITTSASISPIVITGLVSNTEYVATLRAQNSVGYSSGIDSIPVTTGNQLSGVIETSLTTEGVAMRLNSNPVISNGIMWVTGTTGSSTDNRIRGYNITNDVWLTGLSTGTFGMGANTATMHEYDDKIYCFLNSSTAYRRYDVNANAISSTTWSSLSYVGNIAAVDVSSALAVGIGENENYFFITSTTNGKLGVLNVNTNTVTFLASSVLDEVPNGTSLRQATMSKVGNDIYLLVSRANQTPYEINIFYKFNLITNTWIRLADIPTRIVYGYMISDGAGNIYCYGGSVSTSYTGRHNKLQRYDIALDMWYEVASIGTNKTYNGLAWHNSKLYSYCGIDDTAAISYINEFIRIG